MIENLIGTSHYLSCWGRFFVSCNISRQTEAYASYDPNLEPIDRDFVNTCLCAAVLSSWWKTRKTSWKNEKIIVKPPKQSK